MKVFRGLCFLILIARTTVTFGQVPQVEPQILTKTELEGRVTVIEVAPRFVTTIRLPEPVNSVVVGNPSEFQVEHSEREPRLVFVKALTTKSAKTNLLISTASGHQASLLLVNRGESASQDGIKVTFLVSYEPSRGFLVEPDAFPFAFVGQRVDLAPATLDSKIRGGGLSKPSAGSSLASKTDGLQQTEVSPSQNVAEANGLDELLEQQRRSRLPALYGEHISDESERGGRVRAGVSRVIDHGQSVVVLFSVVNPSKHAILLMPPQVQLGGKVISGKVIRHSRRSTAEQLPVLDFRLSKRRVGPGERADGVVLFERPPYKQSNETLLLQVAEAGTVDRPALAPIGFGVSTLSEDQNGGGK